MSRYSKIDRRIWRDAKFRSLSRSQPCGQALFLYLLTNPLVGPIPGIYSAGEAGLTESLCWSTQGLRKAFGELFREGLVEADFGAQLIWIPNCIRYNEPDNANIVKGWRDSWDELPECPLKRKAWEALLGCLKHKGEAWSSAFLDVCPKPSLNGSAKGMPKGSANRLPNQEQEQEQDQEQNKSSIARISGSHECISHKRAAQIEPVATTIYDAYPRRVAKASALRAIKKAIVQVSGRGEFDGDTEKAAEWLRHRVQGFAESRACKDKQYIPYPGTWFNDQRYDDDSSDWNHAGFLSGISARTPHTPVHASRTEGFEEVLSRPAPAWQKGDGNG